MNKQQLKQDIESMKQRLASMEAELNKPTGTIFIPENGKRYYYIDYTGCVLFLYYTLLNNSCHKSMFDFGNLYCTEEEATKARDKKLAYVRVTRKLRELEGDWVPDWSDDWIDKFRVSYNSRKRAFYIEANAYIVETDKAMYSTKEACQWVIDNMADDLKLIFEVE